MILDDGRTVIWCLRTYCFLNKATDKYYYDTPKGIESAIKEWFEKRLYDSSISFTVSTIVKDNNKETENVKEIF